MVGVTRGQVNESHGVGGISEGWLSQNRDFTHLPAIETLE